MPKCKFLFCADFGFRNPTKEIFSELDEINAQYLIFPGSFQSTEEGPEGSQGGPGGHPARPHPWPCQGGAWGPWSTSGCPPSPIYSPSRGNSEDKTLFRKLASVPPPPRFRDREHQKTSSRHPVGGRIDLRESPLHHGCSPDDS